MPDPRLPTPDCPASTADCQLPALSFCLLTPPGRGAIATIGVRGAGATSLVARHFQPASGKSLTATPAGRAVFGRFHFAEYTLAGSASEGSVLSITEDLVVGLIAPDEVEINCHGGNAAAGAICEALLAGAARRVTSQEWAVEHEADRLAADALVALASARTERTAAILLDQYRGALREALSAIDQLLSERDDTTASAALKQLLERADVGRHLTQPWRVVIAGAPNAGKSRLMNAILGYERSIVWREPGTTRDVLSAGTAIDGWPVELFDTAGLRNAAEPLEAEGIARAEDQIGDADLILFVSETTSAWDGALFGRIASAARRPPLVVHNKCDLTRPPDDGRPGGAETSAASGAGIDTLCRWIATALVPLPPPPGAAVPFNARQIDAVESALEALANDNLTAARECLKPLLGD